MKKISRQRAWQLKKESEGLCPICGGGKGASKLVLCFRCADKKNAANKRKKGKA